MPWARLDDQFPDHPKVLALSDREFRVVVSALCYVQRYRTHGHIPRQALRQIGATIKLAGRLVLIGLWELDGNGWAVHDWHLYNSRESLDRGLNAERQRRYRERQRRDDE